MPSCSTTRDPRRDKGPRSVRGRQSANPRITGGLVSHEQAKRSLVSSTGIRDMATGSKRAAIRVPWSACPDLPALGSQVRKLTLRRPASVGSGAAGLAGRPGAGPPGYPASRPRDPIFTVPSQRTPSPAARRPEEPLQHGPQIPPASTLEELLEGAGPILTKDRMPSAVPTGVPAARTRP
jgi:hypothetical protein